MADTLTEKPGKTSSATQWTARIRALLSRYETGLTAEQIALTTGLYHRRVRDVLRGNPEIFEQSSEPAFRATARWILRKLEGSHDDGGSSAPRCDQLMGAIET